MPRQVEAKASDTKRSAITGSSAYADDDDQEDDNLREVTAMTCRAGEFGANIALTVTHCELVRLKPLAVMQDNRSHQG